MYNVQCITVLFQCFKFETFDKFSKLFNIWTEKLFLTRCSLIFDEICFVAFVFCLQLLLLYVISLASFVCFCSVAIILMSDRWMSDGQRSLDFGKIPLNSMGFRVDAVTNEFDEKIWEWNVLVLWLRKRNFCALCIFISTCQYQCQCVSEHWGGNVA